MTLVPFDTLVKHSRSLKDPTLCRYSGPLCCWPKWDHLQGSKRHGFSKFSLAQVWTQMSLALSSIKFWNTKRWIEGLIMKGHTQCPMGDSFAFPQLMKWQMVFLMAWQGIDWPRWLNGRMAKRMDNERFPMNFPHGMKRQMHSNVAWKNIN
jgi:hypothetical protein